MIANYCIVKRTGQPFFTETLVDLRLFLLCHESYSLHVTGSLLVRAMVAQQGYCIE